MKVHARLRLATAVMAAFAVGAVLAGCLRFDLSIVLTALKIAPYFAVSWLLLVIFRAGVPTSARAVASFFLAVAFAWENWPGWFRDSMRHVSVEHMGREEVSVE